MRFAMGAFGLLGLLIAVALILYLQSWNAQTVLTAAKPARQQAERMSGRNAAGRSVMEDVQLVPQLAGDQIRSMKVASITAGSEIEQYFGLKVGDEIIEAQLTFPPPMGDAETARNLIMDQYQKGQEIVVLRAGQRLTLPVPQTPGSAVPAAGATPAPARAPSGSGNPLQDQLNAISGPR